MSRFNNPKARSGLLIRPSNPAIGVAAEPPRSFVKENFRPTAPLPARVFSIGSEANPNVLQVFCFFVVIVYLLSGFLSDLVFHFTHGRAYVPAVCEILLPLLFLGTGAFLRGLQTPTGKWFLAFAAWLALATPFSIWRGGSANLLMNYLGRAFLVCFYIAACVITVRQVRTLVRVMGIGALFVLVSCFVFGGWIQGRFSVVDSLFYGNANELGLQLLLGVIILMYSFFEKNKWAKLVSTAGIFVSVVYILKTGSRGCFLATLSTAFLVFLMSRRRMAVILVAVSAVLIGVVLAPPAMRHRITLMGSEPQSENDSDASAIGSRLQREKLLKASIFLAITHPLVGVGPGQFAVQVAGEDEKQGKHSEWLGTHNSYTQVASEAGLPAFIFYIATIVTCMRLNYRLYRRSVGLLGLEQIAGISFCLFLSTCAYGIAIFFFHEAYGLHLPLLAGISISLHLAAKPVLERYEEAPV